MRPILLILIFIWSVSVSLGQTFNVKGIVKDAKNGKALAFVNIISENNRYGTVTDIDGKFSLTMDTSECCLRLSYVGYKNKEVPVSPEKRDLVIFLDPQSINLREVTILPGINPAYRIIDSVMKHKKENNPEKLKAFTYVSYDKVKLTANIDSSYYADTALLADTNARKALETLKKQDLFMLETVTERKHMAPDLNQENVIATKVSGFKDPVIVFMISQIQSTSFYSDQINLLGKSYANPISRGSKRKYFFHIEDTTYTERGDTVFIISYRPLLNTKFDALKGFLYINSNRWAIQNVKAEPARDTSGMIIHIQQAYEFIQGHWFPVQLNTNIDFMMAAINLGDTALPLTAIGKSYIRDIDLNPDIKKSDFGYHEVEVAPDAVKKKGEFWKKFRVDSLTRKEKETYRIIDSIGKAANFDKIASVTTTLMSGNIPFHFVDIELDKLIRYSIYEGLSLGAGLHTNHLFSKRITLGGFFAYGFGDKTAKYGLNGSVILHKRSETQLYLSLYQKAEPSGDMRFGVDNRRIWNTDDFYTFYYKRMNLTRGGEMFLSFRLKPMRDFKWYTGFRYQNKRAFDDYRFVNNAGDTLNLFRFRDLIFGFRFAFREKMIQTTKGYISMGSRYPIVNVRIVKGMKGWLDGDFDYTSIGVQIKDDIHFNYLGDFTYRIMAGKVFGNIPSSNLFTGRGTYSTAGLFAPNSFGTMRPGEFLSDRYAALFLSFNTGKLLNKKQGALFNPQIVLLTNMGIGALDNKKAHLNYNYKTMEKGYFESGFVVRKLLDFQVYDLGVGVLYRYGAYSLPKVFDNFGFKISLYYGF